MNFEVKEFSTNSENKFSWILKIFFFLIYHLLMLFLMHSEPAFHLKYYIQLITDSFVQPQPGQA